MTAEPAPRFDVRGYVRTPIDVRPAHLDLDAGASLAPAARDALSHLWQVEHGVLDLMRDLLVTPTHAEARVTAFLGTWAYEQFWVAQSMAALLERDGELPEHGDSRVGALLRTWDTRTHPVVGAIRTNLLGHDVVASHMVTGALSTAVLDLGIARLGERAPALRDLAAAVAPVKSRHLEFYLDEAAERLASPSAQRLARAGLRGWRWPGSRYQGRAAVQPVVTWLLADPAAAERVRAIDATIAALPGLDGAAPLRRALADLV